MSERWERVCGKDRGRLKEKWVTNVGRGTNLGRGSTSPWNTPLVKGVVVVINASGFPEDPDFNLLRKSN